MKICVNRIYGIVECNVQLFEALLQSKRPNNGLAFVRYHFVVLCPKAGTQCIVVMLPSYYFCLAAVHWKLLHGKQSEALSFIIVITLVVFVVNVQINFWLERNGCTLVAVALHCSARCIDRVTYISNHKFNLEQKSLWMFVLIFFCWFVFTSCSRVFSFHRYTQTTLVPVFVYKFNPWKCHESHSVITKHKTVTGFDFSPIRLT